MIAHRYVIRLTKVITLAMIGRHQQLVQESRHMINFYFLSSFDGGFETRPLINCCYCSSFPTLLVCLYHSLSLVCLIWAFFLFKYCMVISFVVRFFCRSFFFVFFCSCVWLSSHIFYFVLFFLLRMACSPPFFSRH